MASFNFLAIALGLLSLFTTLTLAQNTTSDNVKIMAFGASIVGAPGCWRALLWRNLTDAGYNSIKFVGSLPAPTCAFPYDGHNEGHAGYLATDIVKNDYLTGWLASSKPDVVLMHLGTNDVIQHKTNDQILEAYGTLVDQMRRSNANMQIIISLLIPIAPNKFTGAAAGIVSLNKAITAWGPSKNTAQSPIRIVDAFTGFNATTDTRDGEHPNDSGDRKLASVYLGPLERAIEAVEDPDYV